MTDDILIFVLETQIIPLMTIVKPKMIYIDISEDVLKS